MLSPSLLLLLLLTSALQDPRPGADPPRGFEVGQRLPELVLPTIDGERAISLADLRGRRLLLIQFASW